MTASAIKNILVLVADDNEILGSSIARHLHRQGFSVCRVCDIEQAKRIIGATEKTKQAYELVISDIFTPSRGGVAFISWLHAHHPEMAVLAISGFGHADLLNTLIRPDRDSIRKKPVRPDEIVDAILSIEKKKQEWLAAGTMTQEPCQVLLLECSGKTREA